jgi:hypothetical protein
MTALDALLCSPLRRMTRLVTPSPTPLLRQGGENGAREGYAYCLDAFLHYGSLSAFPFLVNGKSSRNSRRALVTT